MARKSIADEAGVTLTELLVVIVMIGLLVAVALPRMSSDPYRADAEKLAGQLTQDLQAARMQAIASKELREIWIDGAATRYFLNAVTPGTPEMIAQLRKQPFPANAIVAGYKLGALETSGSSPAGAGVMEIRFSMIGDLQIKGSSGIGGCPNGASDCSTVFCPCSITIFVKSTDDRYKSRVIVYKATGYARQVEGW